jgi:hypothetical protein
MSTLYKVSLCLSNIPKEAIKIASDGKAYINADLWINEAVNEKDNIGSLSISQTKEQRERKDKKTYIGNVKEFKAKEPDASSAYDEFLAK